MQESHLDQAAEKILQDLGLTGLEEKTKQELLNAIKDRVAKRILAAILEGLDPADLEVAEAQIEAGKNEEEVLKELASRVSDLELRVTNALVQLYDELVSDVKSLRESLKQSRA